MANRPLERSVDSLQKVYAVIIALAIGRTVQEVFSGSNWSEMIESFHRTAPALLSFFLIVVPFYQGMNRHLDVTYTEKSTDYSKIGLLLDFFFFCIIASLLFLFASFLKLGKESFIVLGIALAVDIFWALMSHLINYRHRRPSTISWAAVNFLTLIAGIFIYVYDGNISINVMWVLFILLLTRTVADYILMQSYYFPETD